jgi:hypothetical protein
MNMRYLTKQSLILIAIGFLFFSSATAKAQPVKGSFLYTLSNFTGTIPYNWSRVVVDKGRNEAYVLYQNALSIFNEFGMEIYRFGDDLDLNQIVDIAVHQNGDILLLAYKESGPEIIRCNFRGEPKSKIELKNIPSEFSKFSPSRMVYQDGNLHLVSLMEMKVVIVNDQGHFKKGYDLLPLLDLEEKDRGSMEIVGFNVDREGNILFTVPVLFKACVLSPDGKLTWFGRPGSASGRFNVVAGIAKDSRGNYLVIDKLKCTVMVFDKNFNFLTQFGYRGSRPGNLIAPDDIAVDNSDRIYVTQAARKGVSVFRIIHN